MVEFDRDVIVVGGGLSGCIAARFLSTLGFRVAVIDRVADARPEFRAEQIVGGQIAQLDALGVLAPMIRGSVESNMTFNGRRGVIVDRSAVQQYGVPYQSMIAGARSVLAADDLLVGKVVGVETSPTRQTVRLLDGQALGARLVVLATGLLPHIARSLNIVWETISEAHSLCIGFNIALHESKGQNVLPLIYYGERVADRTDYLALFRMGDTIRANLFCYHLRDSEWTRKSVVDPTAGLRGAMPGLEKLIGRFSVAPPVEARNNDIRVAKNVLRDGIVIIGDAYQTPCPSAGTGIDRILSDVAALGRHMPRWLTESGVGAAQIAAYYDDPLKRAFDAECIRIARYRRAVSTESSLAWRLHRLRTFVQRYAMEMAKSLTRRRPSIETILGPDPTLPASGS